MPTESDPGEPNVEAANKGKRKRDENHDEEEKQQKEVKLGIKMKKMKENLKGKSPVDAYQFSENPNLQHQSLPKATFEEAKIQRKINSQHSTGRILTLLMNYHRHFWSNFWMPN